METNLQRKKKAFIKAWDPSPRDHTIFSSSPSVKETKTETHMNKLAIQFGSKATITRAPQANPSNLPTTPIRFRAGYSKQPLAGCIFGYATYAFLFFHLGP